MERRDDDALSTALVLSHCTPDRHGNTARRETWALLERVSCQHRVALLCLPDGPIHLSQWRALDVLVDRLALEPPRRRWVAFAPAHKAARRWPASLTDAGLDWSRQTHWEAVVFTDGSLLPTARRIAPTARLHDAMYLAATRPGDAAAWPLRPVIMTPADVARSMPYAA